MLTLDQYLNAIFNTAERQGYAVEINRNGKQHIDFGNKKLHEGHLRQLYPAILLEHAHIPTLVERVAPGRPCSHRPLREIIESITQIPA